MKSVLWSSVRSLQTHCRLLQKDQRGNVVVFLALASLPMMVVAGAAIDYTRLNAARANLQAAADAAALAGAQADPPTLANAQATAQRIFDGHLGANGATMTLSRSADGTTHLEATKIVPTTIMQIVGKKTMVINLVSEAVAFSGGAIEVALALDNTGSMVNDMPALRTAATNLVNGLFTSASGNPNFRMSVIPFVAAVNPGRDILEADSATIDKAGKSKWNGQPMKWQWIAHQANCTQTWPSSGGGGSSSGPGTGGQGAWLTDFFWPAKKIATELFGIKQAWADSGVTPGTMTPLQGSSQLLVGGKFVPTGFIATPKSPDTGNCDLLSNPGIISNWDLFQRIPSTTAAGASWSGWKGCVEARPNLSNGAYKDYDVTDDEPAILDPNSQYVPYFWPDEADAFATWVPTYANNYLLDGTLKTGSTTTLQSDPTGNPKNNGLQKQWGHFDDDLWRRNFNLLKYNGVNRANISEAGINTSGPNKACPDPVLPLTNSQQTILNKISGLTYWNGGGTIISEGMAWAWRTLSPNKPFATALPYDKKNQKVIVLMTDGKNELGENGRYSDGTLDSPTYSQYSAYGYLRNGRFPQETFTSATDHFNDRLNKVCQNAKAKDITVFTVLFRETDPTIKSILASCASKPEYAYTSSSGADLVSAFGQIGGKISQLRLKR